MLQKICSIIFEEKKLKKIYKISKISFFLGVLLIIAFPIISQNIKIEEKQLKNTSLFSRNIEYQNYNSYIRSYFSEKQNQNDKILNFCTQIFYNSTNKPYNYIFSKDIVCPRCKKLQMIQINLIYDKTLRKLEFMKKSNFIFYALMRYLSDENHITWLSKDLQFNYVSKELFDENPKECYELLTKGKYNKKIEDGKIIHAIYNFDLTEIDIEHFYQILIKIVGVNSELVDIDFYRMVVSNFQANFDNQELFITTNDAVFSKKTANKIYKIIGFFGDFANNFISKKEYAMRYFYLTENIVNNFFMINNKINTNHLFITNGYSSLLFKTLGKTKPQTREKQLSTCYKLIASILLMIKGISNEEVDLFRGLYFYLLTSPFQCINYFYLFVLILMFIREFYNLIDLIYHNEYKFIWTIKNPFYKIDNMESEEKRISLEKNAIYASRIISTLFFIGIIYIFFMINLEKFMNLINVKKPENAYYFMLLNIFINQLFILCILGLSRAEEKFIDIIIMYLIVLNCWNFVFINVGVGMVIAALMMSLEFIFLHLKGVKKNVFKIALIIIILFGVLSWKELIVTMANNYIIYQNNIYTIITMTMILLTLRLALFIVMLTNRYIRKEPWDYDEIIYKEEIEDDNKEKEKDKKEEEEKISEIVEKNEEENEENEDKKENNINNENNNNSENNIGNENDIIINEIKENSEEEIIKEKID